MHSCHYPFAMTVKIVDVRAFRPLSEQFAVIGQSPGVVFPPTSHDQLMVPLASAVFGSSPRAVDAPDLSVTVIAQETPAAVCKVAVATLPRWMGDVMLVKAAGSVVGATAVLVGAGMAAFVGTGGAVAGGRGTGVLVGGGSGVLVARGAGVSVGGGTGVLVGHAANNR